MEDIIEDFLRYVSENLKGGMAFEKALLAAIRPKFGILAEEIKLITKKIMTGQDMEDALLEFTEKYDSPLLRRSFQLIIEGLKGGGRITDIIDRTEDTIRETKELKAEMITTNKTYSIFLNFSVMVIAPTLFALSYTLVQILKSLAGKIQLTSIASSSFTLDLSYLVENEALDNNFAMFSMGAIVVLAIATASINSIIKNGNIKEGLKYVPSYVILSLVLYFIIRSVFLMLFGGLLG